VVAGAVVVVVAVVDNSVDDSTVEDVFEDVSGVEEAASDEVVGVNVVSVLVD